MNNLKKHIYLLSVIGLLPLLSCQQDGEVNPGEEDAEFLERVAVVYARSQEDSGFDIPPLDDIEDHDANTDNFEASSLLNDAFKPKIDTLFFSQLNSGILVPFQAKPVEEFPDNMPEDMRKKFEKGYPNVYRYYYDPYSAVWEDDPGGYNFFPNDTTSKMNWRDISFWGKNNNVFALYGLYYPYNNKLPYNDDGTLKLEVEEDQSSIDALRRSNFIGAYHSSPKAKSRLKFRLFHLMCYLKVTLYIPVFNDNDVDDKGNKIRTGYPADALQSAEVRFVMNKFSINWYGGKTSDTAPPTSAVTGSDRTTILMHIPTAEEYTESNGLPPQVTINPREFYRDGMGNVELDDTDVCWKITLSALVPAGQNYANNDPNNPGLRWIDQNFLRFNLRQNIGDVPKRYIFTGNSAMGLIGDGDVINISQGAMQHLSLYLPRRGAAAVLLNANVAPWEEWYNDNMGLRKDDPKTNE